MRSNRVLLTEELASQCFINYDYPRSAFVILLNEAAASPNRDSHSLKIIFANPLMMGRGHITRFRRRSASNEKFRPRRHAAHRQGAGSGNRFYSRHASKSWG